MNKIKLFEDKKIRTVWNEKEEEWYFSVVDVISALTDSTNPTDYLKKLRKRDRIVGVYIGTNCPQVDMVTNTGKLRKTLAAAPKQLLRIIQSIPSKKAEPFKLWLAQVGQERINEAQNPELTINRAMKQYKALGFSNDWINLRLQSIQVRKELTDEWDNSGVKEGLEYAILTNLMTKEWTGKTVKEYKKHKNLKKENLRDNMTTLELVLNMLAETTTTELSKTKLPKNFSESKTIAKEGGTVASNTRKEIEKRSGRSVISSKNAKILGHREVKKLK
ncbi:MAG: phage antirepressor protein [Endomicrobia bacterium]|nr:phage antirepressor protein [Endomicrobiia bacterium]